MNLTRGCYLAAATALMLMALPLHANIVNPGDNNVPPDVFPNPGDVPLLGDLQGTFSFDGGKVFGTWEEVVLVDPFSVFCNGCLAFGFQVRVDGASNGGVFGVNLGNFFGYATDAGYAVDDNPFDHAPVSVSRGPIGANVGFLFNTSDSFLGPNLASEPLVVITNASAFDTNGRLNFGTFDFDSKQNGKGGFLTGMLEPVPSPEPAAALLMALGLAGIVALRKRIA